jgi:hypothetical protein
MLSVSTEKLTISTDKSKASYPAFKQTGTTNNNSTHSSSFERLLNMQIDGSSTVNHPKIATTGISESAPKEYRDRKLAQMEYEINHGQTEGMELTDIDPKRILLNHFFRVKVERWSKK